MAFNIVFLLPLSRFAKDDPAVSDCFFADGRGEAHISCLLLWPRVPERNRDRQDKEIASLGILAKRFPFFKKVFSFIQTGRWNLKTDIILRLFPLKEAERRSSSSLSIIFKL